MKIEYSNNYLLKWQTKYSVDMPNYIHKEKAGCQKWEVKKYVLGVLKNSFKNWFIKCFFPRLWHSSNKQKLKAFCLSSQTDIKKTSQFKGCIESIQKCISISLNSWGWEGTLEALSKNPAQIRPSRAGCPGPFSDGFWLSPRTDIPPVDFIICEQTDCNIHYPAHWELPESKIKKDFAPKILPVTQQKQFSGNIFSE